MSSKKHPGITEAWFFTSEIEGERAGSFRQERWCRVFLEAGIPIRIFNVRGAFHLSSPAFSSELDFLRFRKQAVAKAMPQASVRQGLIARTLRRVKHFLLVDLYYPNVMSTVWRATAELRRTRIRVFVMGSSPPFSLAMAGVFVKALNPGQVVLGIDMRDGWAMHRSLGGSKILKRWMERWVLSHANYVSTVSFGLKDEFEASYAVVVDVLYNVATHYFEVTRARPVQWAALNPRIDPKRIKLIYTGSTPEGFYDLQALVAAVKELRRSVPLLADRIQLVFVGACDEVGRELRRQHVHDNDIVLVPHVSHDTAKDVQQSADGLLYLTYCGKGAVSTKIFEYLALGKPIFPLFVPLGSDVDRLLTQYGGSSLILHGASEIVEALQRVVAPDGLTTLPRMGDPSAVKPLFERYKNYVSRIVSQSIDA